MLVVSLVGGGRLCWEPRGLSLRRSFLLTSLRGLHLAPLLPPGLFGSTTDPPHKTRSQTWASGKQ